MSDGGNPLGALVGLWMFLKLVGVLASLAGGIYALFCLSRIASGAHRIADALDLAAQQNVDSLNAPRSLATMQPFSPATTASIPTVAPAAPETTSSTRSPEMTEHDVRPRSDSF